MLLVGIWGSFSHAQTIQDSVSYCINNKQYQKAINYCKRIIDSDATSHEIGEAYFSMGYAYKKIDETPDATEAYLNALNYYQDREYKASAYTNLGNIFFNASMFEEAIEFYYYSDSLETDPYFRAKNILNRAFAQRKLEHFELATSDAQTALDIAESINNTRFKFRALNELGLIKKDQGYFEEAIKFFVDANNLGADLNALVNLGNTYRILQQPEVAIDYYEKAIPVSNNRYQFRAHQNMANLYMDLKNYNLALYNFQKAKELFPTIVSPDKEFIRLFEQLANFYEVTNDKDQALLIYKKLTTLLFEFNEKTDKLKQQFEQAAISKTKNEHDLALQNEAENRQFWTAILGIILVSLFLLTILWYKKRKVLKKYLSNRSASTLLKEKINRTFEKYPTS